MAVSPREHDAVISVFDHGFLYGEGVYETLRTYNQRPFLFDRHMRRLRNSASMIALPMPFTDAELAAADPRHEGGRRSEGRPRPTSACWSPAASAS